MGGRWKAQGQASPRSLCAQQSSSSPGTQTGPRRGAVTLLDMPPHLRRLYAQGVQCGQQGAEMLRLEVGLGAAAGGGVEAEIGPHGVGAQTQGGHGLRTEVQERGGRLGRI
jgi:hypothetical protein